VDAPAKRSVDRKLALGCQCRKLVLIKGLVMFQSQLLTSFEMAKSFLSMPRT